MVIGKTEQELSTFKDQAKENNYLVLHQRLVDNPLLKKRKEILMGVSVYIKLTLLHEDGSAASPLLSLFVLLKLTN